MKCASPSRKVSIPNALPWMESTSTPGQTKSARFVNSTVRRFRLGANPQCQRPAQMRIGEYGIAPADGARPDCIRWPSHGYQPRRRRACPEPVSASAGANGSTVASKFRGRGSPMSQRRALSDAPWGSTLPPVRARRSPPSMPASLRTHQVKASNLVRVETDHPRAVFALPATVPFNPWRPRAQSSPG
jgi:hypothetical protein